MWGLAMREAKQLFLLDILFSVPLSAIYLMTCKNNYSIDGRVQFDYTFFFKGFRNIDGLFG